MADPNRAELNRDDLDAWEVEPLAAGLEDRVLTQLHDSPAEAAPARSRSVVWIALAAAVVLGVVAAALLRPSAGEPDGVLVVELAGGARAYPQPRALLDVESTAHASTVRQDTGEVLYTVPQGTDLVVQTAAGDVTVGGTRFTVEVMEMNAKTRQTLMGAGALAMGTIAVAVYVHEGSVSLANPRGEVRVKASKRAFATDRSAPEIPGASSKPEAHAVAAPPPAKPAATARKRALRDDMRNRIRAALRDKRARAPVAESSDEPQDELPHGTLKKEYIREVVREQVVELVRECYNNTLERDDTAAGKIVMNFQIVGDESVGGIVDQIDVAEGTTILDPEMQECVLESMASATFDPPEGGGIVEITYPFIFEPG